MKRKPAITAPELVWSTFAPGTGAWNPDHHSYSAATEWGTFHIDPPSAAKRGRDGYAVKFSTNGKAPYGVDGPLYSSGLWHWLTGSGSADRRLPRHPRSPQAAKALCQRVAVRLAAQDVGR